MNMLLVAGREVSGDQNALMAELQALPQSVLLSNTALVNEYAASVAALLATAPASQPTTTPLNRQTNPRGQLNADIFRT